MLVALAIGVTAAGCGRTDIEDTQRKWLEEQHTLDKRLLDVQRELNEVRRGIDPRGASDVDDSVSLRRFESSSASIEQLAARIAALDTMIDRHSLARDNAIRADDADAVNAGWSSARIDYEAARAEIDAIDEQLDVVARDIDAIRYRDAPDTLGSNDALEADTGRGGGASAKDDTKPLIENKIGREEPLEPE